MLPAVIDACCLIDLLASERAEDVLRATGQAWQVPTVVQNEVHYVRRSDPQDATKHIQVAIDLGPMVEARLLTLCQPDNEQETDLFTRYAIQFRSDGEAMCVALAEARGWIIATDDRKAIRLSRAAGLTVRSCPELIRHWAKSAHPDEATVIKVIRDIERFAQFRPNENMPEHDWWMSRGRS